MPVPTICSTLNGKVALKHPELGVLVREDGAVFMRTGNTQRRVWKFGNEHGDGYRVLDITNPTCHRNHRHVFVHRLVASCFVANPDGKPCVDHINRNRSDNRAENLRWVTYSENNKNTALSDASVVMYGVRCSEDKKAYNKAYKAEHPMTQEARDRRNERRRMRYATDPEYRLRRLQKDGKHGKPLDPIQYTPNLKTAPEGPQNAKEGLC